MVFDSDVVWCCGSSSLSLCLDGVCVRVCLYVFVCVYVCVLVSSVSGFHHKLPQLAVAVAGVTRTFSPSPASFNRQVEAMRQRLVNVQKSEARVIADYELERALVTESYHYTQQLEVAITLCIQSSCMTASGNVVLVCHHMRELRVSSFVGPVVTSWHENISVVVRTC